MISIKNILRKKWTQKFNGLDDMMDNIERFMWFDTVILQVINDMS